MRATAAGWLLAAAVACSTPMGPGSSSGPASLHGYRVVGDVRLPGDASRWDYQVYDHSSHRDPATHLVHVASGSDNRLVVVDPATDTALGRYPLNGCGGAHGV